MLSSLPLEVLITVVDHIEDISDLKRLRRVCRTLDAIIAKRFWSTLVIDWRIDDHRGVHGDDDLFWWYMGRAPSVRVRRQHDRFQTKFDNYNIGELYDMAESHKLAWVRHLVVRTSTTDLWPSIYTPAQHQEVPTHLLQTVLPAARLDVDTAELQISGNVTDMRDTYPALVTAHYPATTMSISSVAVYAPVDMSRYSAITKLDVNVYNHSIAECTLPPLLRHLQLKLKGMGKVVPIHAACLHGLLSNTVVSTLELQGAHVVNDSYAPWTWLPRSTARLALTHSSVEMCILPSLDTLQCTGADSFSHAVMPNLNRLLLNGDYGNSAPEWTTMVAGTTATTIHFKRVGTDQVTACIAKLPPRSCTVMVSPAPALMLLDIVEDVLPKVASLVLDVTVTPLDQLPLLISHASASGADSSLTLVDGNDNHLRQQFYSRALSAHQLEYAVLAFEHGLAPYNVATYRVRNNGDGVTLSR